MSVSAVAFQRCINPDCGATYAIDQVLRACSKCNSLLDVAYDWDRIEKPARLSDLQTRWSQRHDPLAFSGVWRFKSLLNFAPDRECMTIGEGQTLLRPAPNVAAFVDTDADNLFLQYEGLNPTGSFKDNGMTAAFTHARLVGARVAACASTGNTSASLAAYAGATHLMRALIFIGSGKIAFGKLAQALEYGATTLQIDGDFDDAMKMVTQITDELGIYLVNSINPFRLEGQKAIMYRILEGLAWREPDWVLVPGGNLGNSSAFGKAFRELYDLGLIKRLPRLGVIVADGAPTLDELFNKRGLRWNDGRYDRQVINDYYAELDRTEAKAKTLASAIEINRPVNLTKCIRALEWTDGVVGRVSDQEIMDAKAIIGQAGIGCEPASAASVAGLRKLIADGTIGRDERVACVLTGHPLKAPNEIITYHADSNARLTEKLGEYGVTHATFANGPTSVPNDADQVMKMLEQTVLTKAE